MNFRLKNFKKAAKVEQNQAPETAFSAEVQAVIQESAAAIQAEQTEAIAQVKAEIQATEAPTTIEGVALSPEQEALVKAYVEQENAKRIKRMQDAKKAKAEERKRLAEEAEKTAKAEAEAKAKAEAAEAAAKAKAKAEAEARETEALKAKRTALEKQRDRLAAEAAVKDLEAEIALLQGKVSKASTQAQATKNPETTKTVVAPKPKIYDDNFIVALRKRELLKAAKDPQSKKVRMYVEVDGKQIPMKDAFRALTGSTATNDELDSSAIAKFFDKHGIKYVRES